LLLRLAIGLCLTWRLARAARPINGLQMVDADVRVSREVGHTWRERDLGPVVTTHLFLQQALHGNVAVGELRRLSGLAFTDAAYCQARARLPLGVYEELTRRAVERALPLPRARDQLWLGRHRTLLVDGTTAAMPDTAELDEHYARENLSILGAERAAAAFHEASARAKTRSSACAAASA